MRRARSIAIACALVLAPSLASAQTVDPGAPPPSFPAEGAAPTAPVDYPPIPVTEPPPAPPEAPTDLPPEGSPDAPLRPLSSRARMTAAFYGGPSLRELYGIAFFGGDFGVAFGGDWSNFGLRGVVEGFAGTTTFGLLTGQLRWGVTTEGRIDRFRFGGGLTPGFLFVRRITKSTTLTDFTLGPELHFSVDVVRWNEHALYLAIRGNLDFLMLAIGSNAGTPIMGELSVLLGIRL
jgi:hypothetical protein